MSDNRKNNLLAILFSLPWCCILLAILLLFGLIAGVAAVRSWGVKVSPFLFILSLLFLIRAYWLLYVKHQGSKISAVIVWITTVTLGFFWFFRLRYFLRLLVILVIISLIFTNFVLAHEPVFSLGPETIYKGGVGIETEVEYEKSGSEQSVNLHEEIIYGLRENFSLTTRFPFILKKKEAGSTSSGLGDLALRGKVKDVDDIPPKKLTQ